MFNVLNISKGRAYTYIYIKVVIILHLFPSHHSIFRIVKILAVDTQRHVRDVTPHCEIKYVLMCVCEIIAECTRSSNSLFKLFNEINGLQKC